MSGDKSGRPSCVDVATFHTISDTVGIYVPSKTVMIFVLLCLIVARIVENGLAEVTEL